jgi:UDP-N-acetylglucosamine:LPS N-acetylglucosamine transferase
MVHNIYLSKKADLTLVSTLTAYQLALNSGILPQQLEVTGHPIREEFTKTPKDIKLLKKDLGLDPDMFTILFGGSGHGAEKTLEILIHLGAKPSGNLIKRLVRLANLDYKTYYKLFFRIFKQQRKNISPFQAICACGDNTELKEELELLDYPSYIKPFIFPKTDNMASLMQASDLVIAKAGPNVLFESIATNKPFLATYHIKGQEDGNIDLIKCAQLGFSEENPQKTAYLIETILKNKELLDYTRPGISFIREQQKDAAQKIADNILKYLNKK